MILPAVAYVNEQCLRGKKCCRLLSDILKDPHLVCQLWHQYQCRCEDLCDLCILQNRIVNSGINLRKLKAVLKKKGQTKLCGKLSFSF